MNKSELSKKESCIRSQAIKDGVTHLSTGLAIIKDKRILIVRRVANDFLGGNYELPGGGTEEGEDFLQSVKREALEETGLQVDSIVNLFDGFDYTTDKKPKVRQINFIVNTPLGEIKLSGEHDDYRWISLNDVNKYKMSDSIKNSIKTIFDNL